MVILSGGEPTLHPDLIALADCVADAGMKLGLISNGRRLAERSSVDDLLRRGLSYAYVSLHGSTAPVHNLVVRAQAFDQTLAGIRNLCGRVPELTVNTVVTKDNLHDLARVVSLFDGCDGLCVKFTFPQPKGAARNNFHTVVPTLSDAAAAVVDAIAGSASRGSAVRFGIEGFPSCLVSGFEHLRDDFETHAIRLMSEPEDDDFVAVDTDLLTKTSRCDGCSRRLGCPGIYKAYVQFVGDHEIGAEIQSRGTRPDLPEMEAREQAAHERRHWVRLTFACNNRCRFCLDRHAPLATPLATPHTAKRLGNDIKQDIVQGRRDGAERLILSGGEPTIHPLFSSLVRFGKEAGYRWVQSITNGRMLSYPRFLVEAIRAGLDEITVSMHGHTPLLHDSLVGVPGAFAQASRGIRSALASRRLVVNIDIVINAYNVAHLPDMLQTFVGWGVREFDLLHLIPFGGAWDADNRDLHCDLSQHAEPIRRALSFCRDEGIQVWLNRFPPEHAEGFEYLIQDPHKLHDEVRGRMPLFEAFMSGGPHLPCRSPERCGRCYLKGLCDVFERVRQLSGAESVPFLRVSGETHASLAARLPHGDLLEVVASDVDQALQMVSKLKADSLRLCLDKPYGLQRLVDSAGCVAGKLLKEVVVSRPDQLDIALACQGADVVVLLNRATLPCLGALGQHASRLVLEQPTHELLTTAVQQDVDLRQVFRTLNEAGISVRTRRIAPCLSGVVPRPSRYVLDASVFREDDNTDPLIADPQNVTSWYVREMFFARSLRCNACRWSEGCAGMHLNWLRLQGFGQLGADGG